VEDKTLYSNGALQNRLFAPIHPIIVIDIIGKRKKQGTTLKITLIYCDITQLFINKSMSCSSFDGFGVCRFLNLLISRLICELLE